MFTKTRSSFLKIGVVAIAASLLFAGIATASGKGSHGKYQKKMIDKVASKLSLDDTQKAEFGKLVELHSEKREAMQESMKNQREEGKAAQTAFWAKANLSGADIANHFTNLHQQMQAHSVDQDVSNALANFHNSLSEEQRVEFAKLMTSKRSFMGHGGKRGGRYGRGHHDDDDEDDD